MRRYILKRYKEEKYKFSVREPNDWLFYVSCPLCYHAVHSSEVCSSIIFYMDCQHLIHLKKTNAQPNPSTDKRKLVCVLEEWKKKPLHFNDKWGGYFRDFCNEISRNIRIDIFQCLQSCSNGIEIEADQLSAYEKSYKLPAFLLLHFVLLLRKI